MKLRDDANLLRLPHKIDVDALKKHELEPFRTAVTRRLASYRAKESFKKDGFCSFPHRHCNGTKEASDPSQDTLEHHKRHFVRDFLTFHTSQIVAASKSTFSCEFSYDTTSKSTFRARLPSIFITCHKMQRQRRNLHLVTTLRSADNAIRRKHAT